MDGLMDLNLAGRGASPKHKDIFVEVDHMVGYDFVPPARELSRQAFLSAPNSLVRNPDGKDGIDLHIEYRPLETIPVVFWAEDPWAYFQADKNKFFGTDSERVHPNWKMLREAKKYAYRYCIFAARFGSKGYSGASEDIPGNDFFVSLGTFNPSGGNLEHQAGTFTHELGHTLGLRHGGGDDIGWKPNYLSVMNYMWQFPRPKLLDNKLTWRLIFSPVALDVLDESNLNEAKGLNLPPDGIHPAAVVLYGNDASGYRLAALAPFAAVDWDGNKDSTSTGSTAVDLNGKDDGSSIPEKLEGFADWPAIQYNFRHSAQFPDPLPGAMKAQAEYTPAGGGEMTPGIDSLLNTLPLFGLIPPEQAPLLVPGSLTVVGGNDSTFKIVTSVPAPAGGLVYHFRSLAPGILQVDPVIDMPSGYTERTVWLGTSGVERDTTVYITLDSLKVPLFLRVNIRAASLAALNARGDSGCVVAEPGGFRKRFLAGCTILLESALDGQAPQQGGTVHYSSSRPDLIPIPAPSTIGTFGTNSLVTVQTAPTVSSPQIVVLTATYRDSTRCDTVIIMPAPRYTFEQIGYGSSSSSASLQINNAGDVMIDHFWLLKNGQLRSLTSLPGYRLWNALSLNDSGWICGSVQGTEGGIYLPAYWKPDTTIVLPVLNAGYPRAQANAINNRGDLVGFAEANSYPYFQKAVMWKDGAISELPAFEQYWLTPVAINDSGQAIGNSIYHQSSPYVHREYAIRWRNGEAVHFENPLTPIFFTYAVDIAANGTALYYMPNPTYYFENGSLSPGMFAPPTFGKLKPYDMNDSLHVVGEMDNLQYEEGLYRQSAFVYRGGFQYDLTCLTDFPAGWTKFVATGINNAGIIVGYGSSGGGTLLFRLTPTGSAGVGDQEIAPVLPTEFQLHQNFPNPFNTATVIRYALPSAANVQLEVYSILGQRVRTLVDERKPAGNYEVRFDATSLASGVYIYRLRAGDYTSVRKMVLMK